MTRHSARTDTGSMKGWTYNANFSVPKPLSVANRYAARASMTTATAAAEEFDMNPKTVLMKGTHDPAFFISWQSQRDVVKALGWNSTLMIWGGPALTLLCVYLLAAQFGWL